MSDLAAQTLFVIGLMGVALTMVLLWPRHKPTTAPRRPTFEVVEVTVMTGGYFERWCDDCNRTHGWVSVYAFEGDDPTTARPIALAAVPDEDEDQDGGQDA